MNCSIFRFTKRPHGSTLMIQRSTRSFIRPLKQCRPPFTPFYYNGPMMTWLVSLFVGFLRCLFRVFPLKSRLMIALNRAERHSGKLFLISDLLFSFISILSHPRPTLGTKISLLGFSGGPLDWKTSEGYTQISLPRMSQMQHVKEAWALKLTRINWSFSHIWHKYSNLIFAYQHSSKMRSSALTCFQIPVK